MTPQNSSFDLRIHLSVSLSFSVSVSMSMSMSRAETRKNGLILKGTCRARKRATDQHKFLVYQMFAIYFKHLAFYEHYCALNSGYSAIYALVL